jgi:hypothetical protein
VKNDYKTDIHDSYTLHLYMYCSGLFNKAGCPRSEQLQKENEHLKKRIDKLENYK